MEEARGREDDGAAAGGSTAQRSKCFFLFLLVVVVVVEARRRAANASSSFAHSTSVGFVRERKMGRAQEWLRGLNVKCCVLNLERPPRCSCAYM